MDHQPEEGRVQPRLQPNLGRVRDHADRGVDCGGRRYEDHTMTKLERDYGSC